jgi:tRNA (mo5U34)-methyltransferase
MFAPEPLSVERGPGWARDPESLKRRIDRAPTGWYENFFFSNGVHIPGRSPSSAKLAALGLPNNLTGYTAIDIGAYEGFYSFHLEQRGAQVMANDWFVWHSPNDPARQHFDLVYEAVGSKCDVLDCDIGDLPDTKWDITLFCGVLYHLEDQIGALRTLRRVTSRVAILETLVDCLDIPGCVSAYYPGSSLNEDHTNQFGPNLESLVALINSAGFTRYQFKSLWEFNTVGALSGQGYGMSPLRSGRVVMWLSP